MDNALQGAQSIHAQRLQHLRRFVRPEYLPAHLKNQSILPSRHTDDVLADGKEQETLHDEAETTHSETVKLHLLVCAVADLSLKDVQNLLASDDAFVGINEEPQISIMTVPGDVPASEAQAKQWSQEYWPTIYKKHNPFGAQPAMVALAIKELEADMDEYMDLARKVGKETSRACIGEDIGVVAVERPKKGRPAIVMIAGDARWRLSGKTLSQGHDNGNVMAHAVMRVISLIANKRQAISTGSPSPDSGTRDAFTDIPLTPMEMKAYETSDIEAGGYLCLDLELYLTHEPCIMCSMALLHSRVGRVIFENPMPLTGGLNPGNRENEAEEKSGLGYGLFWRPELNWKFLTWQWRPKDPNYTPNAINENLHA